MVGEVEPTILGVPRPRDSVVPSTQAKVLVFAHTDQKCGDGIMDGRAYKNGGLVAMESWMVVPIKY